MYPDLFEGTSFMIASWEFFLLIGFFATLTLIIILRPKDFPVTRIGLVLFCLLMLGFALLGAKLLYIFLHWKGLIELKIPVTQFFYVAGNTYLGALVAELLVMLVFTKLRIKRISFFKLADYSMPFVFLHQAFIRVGCFLTGCCYGKPTSLPWGFVFPGEGPLPRHPTQIYSVIVLLSIFFVIRRIYKKNYTAGVTFFSSLFMYGILRFFIEFLRVDSIEIIGIITLAQIAMLSIAIVSGVSLWAILNRRNI